METFLTTEQSQDGIQRMTEAIRSRYGVRNLQQTVTESHERAGESGR